MGNGRQKARRLQTKTRNASQSAKKVALKISVPAKKGSIKKEDPADIVMSDGADEVDELEDEDPVDSDEYSKADEAKEVDELDGEGDEQSDEEEEDELVQDKPEAAGSSEYFKITYLVPKGGSNVSKQLILLNTRSWSTFQREVAKIMGVDWKELSVSWRFSSAKSTDPFQSLDSGDEYRAMGVAFSAAVEKACKGSASVTIRVKSQIDQPKPASTSGCGKTLLKAKPGAQFDEGDASNAPWKIVGKLQERYTGKCSRPDHSEKPCYVTNDGAHHLLTIANLTTWATVISHGEATYSEPPAVLKLSDHVPPPRGAPSERSDAQGSLSSQAPAGFMSDPAALSALFGAAVAAGAQAANHAGSSTCSHSTLEAVVDHSQEDEALDFPSLRDWLESITDTQPRLLGYVDVLEDQGLTKLCHVDNSDLTVSTLMAFSGMKFLEASTFLRIGRKDCQEFRNVFKK
ncbi:hypothetical protein BDV93DRAFT_564952 [Ceratobasidium sp. AG-I]|nr:hypothetical protein BDV93DRAFT_564952 [Ceratobasidium sp. AG-I]